MLRIVAKWLGLVLLMSLVSAVTTALIFLFVQNKLMKGLTSNTTSNSDTLIIRDLGEMHHLSWQIVRQEDGMKVVAQAENKVVYTAPIKTISEAEGLRDQYVPVSN